MSQARWIGVLALLGSRSVLAQQATGSAMGDQENLRLLAGNDVNTAVVAVDKRYEGVKGSPYLLPTWSKGTLLLDTQKELAQLPLKYDVYRHQLMLRRPKGDSLWLDLTHVVGFVLVDEKALPGQPAQRRFRRVSAPEGTPNQTEYLEVLDDSGPYQLLKRSGRILQKASFQGAYSADRPYDELLETTAYFLLTPTGKMQEVKTSLKSVVEVAPTTLQEPLRSDFKNKKVRSEDELKQVVARLNTLTTAK